MIDINLLKENPELVKKNIQKRFQDAKLPLVDEVIAYDEKARKAQEEADAIRTENKQVAKEIGQLLKNSDIEEIEPLKAQYNEGKKRIEEFKQIREEALGIVKTNMMVIPNIIDPSVPIGKDESENVEVQRFGKPLISDFDIPFYTDIMNLFDGIDLVSAGFAAGNGFWYLQGDIARLHSAVLSYTRDFMISKGFTYCICPPVIRSAYIEHYTGFEEATATMYKIDGEDLYLTGLSEQQIIGRFIDRILHENQLPQMLTTHSMCLRKEKWTHNHQFDQQEMLIVCKPEESMDWYDKLWKYSAEVVRSLGIPARLMECCSGALADLEAKSCNVEAWSPREKKYIKVNSCSLFGDALARRLMIRIDEGKNRRFAHIVSNTVAVFPGILRVLLENNLREDRSVVIPDVLQTYMDGQTVLIPSN